MKVTLALDLSCSLRAAVAGLRTVTDEGEELLAALEAAAGVVSVEVSPAGLAVAVRRVPVTSEAVVCVYRECGSVKATAKVLGIARSTVRARLRRAGVALPGDAPGPGIKSLPPPPPAPKLLPG